MSQNVYYVAYPRSAQAYNDARSPTWLEQKDIQHLPKILSENGYYVVYPKSAQGYGEARTPTWVHYKRYLNTRGNLACSRRSDGGTQAENKASKRAGKKTRGDWGRGRGNACEINFKKPMPPTLDCRQRQRNMNPRSGQSKQESYVIMLTEINFSRV